MTYVAENDWRPKGIAELEPNAWTAVRAVGSLGVVAGPGAGKTELLAQRAAFLLETGRCPAPRRLLAISFKSDAAANLAARVRQRCADSESGRFVSLTFDAFTKGLVDRFHLAIPSARRPTRPYEVSFSSRRDTEDFLTRARLGAPLAWKADIAALGAADFESRTVGAARLSAAVEPPTSAEEYAAASWWGEHLRRTGPSKVSFVMLNRLAELLLRDHCHIARAIRATYPFVFVDEFQDTTYAQYDFLRSVFGGRAVVTAVGDDKQRIMTWAGARTDSFDLFNSDFGGERIALLCNFRSSPELVRIQHVVARALNTNSVEAHALTSQKVDGAVAQLWSFSELAKEATQVADWISDDMATRGTKPRDYALIVRQKADDFEGQLSGAFAAKGLRIRNESRAVGRTTLQDLLVDDLVGICIALLEVASRRRAPSAWATVSEAILVLRGCDPRDDAACALVETELSEFIADLRRDLSMTPINVVTANGLADRVLSFVDVTAVARCMGEYRSGDKLEIVTEAFRLHWQASALGYATWASGVDAFRGTEMVPLMTVHKSKGLEYDTTVFLGLDDRMWWSHSAGNPEGLATFFVALSRAKQRAIFTFCSERGGRRGVADLFELLARSGVSETTF